MEIDMTQVRAFRQTSFSVASSESAAARKKGAVLRCLYDTALLRDRGICHRPHQTALIFSLGAKKSLSANHKIVDDPNYPPLWKFVESW